MGCATSSSVAVEKLDSIVQTPPAGVHFRTDFDEEFSLGAVLGKGAFGVVRVAREVSSNKLFAVKLIDASRYRDHPEVELQVHTEVTAEVTAWRKVERHPNVVQLAGVFANDRYYALVMEKCYHTLDQARKSDPHYSGEGFPALVRGMLQGVQACHQALVVHRDVKLENFLMGPNDTVKLCDFGLAAVLASSADTLHGEYGTPPFMSPEMVLGERYGASTDVWSLGGVAYVTLFRQLPYLPPRMTVNSKGKGDAQAMKQAIRAGATPRMLEAEDAAGHPAVALLRLLLERDPAKRCDASEALRHPFVAEAMDAPEMWNADSWQAVKQKKSNGTCSLSTTDFALNSPVGHSTANDSAFE